MTNQPIRAVLQAKDIQNLITAAPDATVAAVAALMTQKGVGAVIVRGAGSEIGGIFTERDVMCRVVAERRDPARNEGLRSDEPERAPGERRRDGRGGAAPDGGARPSAHPRQGRRRVTAWSRSAT